MFLGEIKGEENLVMKGVLLHQHGRFCIWKVENVKRLKLKSGMTTELKTIYHILERTKYSYTCKM